nr:MAG TPA: hypothetical protein [Caudoviricetes sp.]
MIIEVDDILVYRNGIPKSIYLGRLYKEGSICSIINSDNYHLRYDNKWYKFTPRDFTISISAQADASGNTVFKAVPENKERFSDVAIEFYNEENELKYLIYIFTTSQMKEFYVNTQENLAGQTWGIKIRNLDGEYTPYDGYWIYKIDKSQITI